MASKKIGVESKKIEAEERPKPFQDEGVRMEESEGSERCRECAQGVRRQKDKTRGAERPRVGCREISRTRLPLDRSLGRRKR